MWCVVLISMEVLLLARPSFCHDPSPMINYALYILAIVSLSQASNLAKWGAAPPDMMGFWRLLIAALIMLPIALKVGKLQELLKTHRKDFRWVALAAFFFFLHLWTYIFAAQNTLIANAMIIFSTNPLITSLGAFFFFNEKFTRRLGFAYVFAFGALYLLVSEKLSMNAAQGDISAFLSAIFFAGYILASKKARQNISNSSYAFVKYLLTGTFFGISGLIQGVSFTGYPDNTWWAIALVILFPTLLGHALISYLMKHLNVNWMSCGKLIEPALSTLVAFLFFKEAVSNRTFVAFALTAVAILILFLPNPRKKRVASSELAIEE